MTAIMSAMMLVSTFVLFNMDQTGHEEKNRRLFIILGLLWGLAIGNHLSQICLVGLVAWAVWAGSSKGYRLKSTLYTIIGLGSGLLVFLWLPIRSHENPIIDWGNVKSFKQFMWSIQRKAWARRALGSAPPDFVIEWIKSYAFMTQMGLLALFSAFIGLIFTLKKRSILAGWLGAIAIPYAVGMIYGHLVQQGIDMSYLTSYGVGDWHLPIFMTLAGFTGFGVAAIADIMVKTELRRASVIVPVFITALFVILAIPAISESSLRHFQAPKIYLDALTARLPKSSIVLLSEDNDVGAFTYDLYIAHPNTERWMIVRISDMGKSISSSLRNSETWGATDRYKYLHVTNMNPIRQPFRIPALSLKQIEKRPIYIDYNHIFPDDAKYILPDGLLFKVAGRPTSDAEVLKAEAEWRQQNPELLRKPIGRQHRLELQAWAIIYQNRGSFFFQRKLWKEAIDYYTRALEWIPNDGQVWYCLGYAFDELGRYEQAIVAYGQAIALVPHMPGARQNLAIIYMQNNEKQKAANLLTEELHVNPKNIEAQHLLDQLSTQTR